jgi:hypothetical protein
MSPASAPLARRRSTILASALVLASATALPVVAQDDGSTIETVLRQYNQQTVVGYVQPLVDLFATDMSSGFFHSASIARGSLGFSFELVAVGSSIEDKHRTYIASTPPGFTPATFETATVFGGTGTTVASETNPSLTYRGSDGFIDADYLPAAAPQLRISLLGMEATVRYLSSSLFKSLPEEDFPDTDLLGIGLRHNISQYLPMLPLDLSIGGFYSSLDMGDIIAYSGLSIGVQASKDVSRVLTLYGGLASETGTVNLTYTPGDPSESPVNIDIDAEGGVRITGGAAFRLGPVVLFGDANFGSATTYAGGIGFGR